MKGNDVVNKVLANVLEEEVSCDVDLHEAIEDQDFEVRGTCGWCGRLQINLTLGSSMRVVEENRVESYKARAWKYWGSNRIDVFWSNYPSRKMMQLILRRHWKLWWLGTTLSLRQVTAIKHSEEDSGCSNWCSKGTGVVLAQFETWTWNNVIHKSKSLNHWCSKGT